MLAVAEPIMAAEVSSQTPEITTLYDLITTLQDQIKPWEEDVVTDSVVALCNRGHMRFLNIAKDCEVVRA